MNKVVIVCFFREAFQFHRVVFPFMSMATTFSRSRPLHTWGWPTGPSVARIRLVRIVWEVFYVKYSENLEISLYYLSGVILVYDREGRPLRHYHAISGEDKPSQNLRWH